MVILSALACIEFYEAEALPPRITFQYTVVPVAADGRCFWSALWLGVESTRRQLFAWYQRTRCSMGLAGGKDGVWEKETVVDWALRLVDMPPRTREGIMTGRCADSADVDTCQNILWDSKSTNINIYYITQTWPACLTILFMTKTSMLKGPVSGSRGGNNTRFLGIWDGDFFCLIFLHRNVHLWTFSPNPE